MNDDGRSRNRLPSGQLAAVKAALPSITEAVVYSPNEDNRKRYAGSMTQILGIDVRTADTPREAVEDADIVLSATNSNVPTFDGDWLSPGRRIADICADC